MPGKKTSVWLGEEELAEWKDSKASLTEIVKDGLAARRKRAAEVQPDLASIAADIQALREDIPRVVRAEIERATGRV
jgi:hypothetical protein